MIEKLKQRTKQIGLDTLKLVEDLPNKPTLWEIQKQVIRSSFSVGANYRAACRAKSSADFINKLKIVEEEADETLFWLEVLEEISMVDVLRVSHIKKEINEVISITVASIKTVRNKENSQQTTL